MFGHQINKLLSEFIHDDQHLDPAAIGQRIADDIPYVSPQSEPPTIR
jgi:hypothetical protein